MEICSTIVVVDLFIVKNNKVGFRNFKIVVCECATTRMAIVKPFTLQGNNNVTIIDSTTLRSND